VKMARFHVPAKEQFVVPAKAVIAAGATVMAACLFFGTPAAAQDKPPAQKTQAKAEKKKVQGGRKKPTPEQIRKFNDLEKKQAK
jgi:hypothetical protein